MKFRKEDLHLGECLFEVRLASSLLGCSLCNEVNIYGKYLKGISLKNFSLICEAKSAYIVSCANKKIMGATLILHGEVFPTNRSSKL